MKRASFGIKMKLIGCSIQKLQKKIVVASSHKPLAFVPKMPRSLLIFTWYIMYLLTNDVLEHLIRQTCIKVQLSLTLVHRKVVLSGLSESW